MPLRRRPHGGTELTNAAITMLTFGNNLVEGGAILRNFGIVNKDSLEHKVTVHLVPVGGSPTEANCIFEETIPAHTTCSPVRGPWQENSGAYVSAISDAADTNVGVRLTAAEEYQLG